jgi:hypothetical protein
MIADIMLPTAGASSPGTRSGDPVGNDYKAQQIAASSPS